MLRDMIMATGSKISPNWPSCAIDSYGREVIISEEVVHKGNDERFKENSNTTERSGDDEGRIRGILDVPVVPTKPVRKRRKAVNHKTDA